MEVMRPFFFNEITDYQLHSLIDVDPIIKTQSLLSSMYRTTKKPFQHT